ncbi:hypothetical protein CHS0354_021661 [Potamilus streckersoni]|uniref:Uncharacterized protein n=1 Tax=Potamilus streckersoni TaxID=2493646 RepID=A0AAE0SNV7_9BIVA|nr:hypothetical protein CHS0354_021661 [Potamilus streckersoni]
MKQTGKTYYVRVGEKLVVLLELHSVHDSKGQQVDSELDWFQKIHLQELLQLVQDVIQQRVEQVATAKQAVAKTTSPSGILTGDSLRLVYTFKKRPGHQVCLIFKSDHDSRGQQEEEEEEEKGDNPGRKNLTVFQDKIIVFVCQRKQEGLHEMSKLLKVLGDIGQQTGSQTVSISSYFNRLPSSQTLYAAGQSVDSQDQQESLSLQPNPHEDMIQNIELEPHGSLPQAPPSEGRRHAIKTILKRNEHSLTMKKEKKIVRGLDAPAVTSAEEKDQESAKFCSDQPEALPEKHQQDDVNIYSCPSPIMCLSPKTKERKCEIETLGDVKDRNSFIDASQSVPTPDIHEISLLGKRKKYDNSDSVKDLFCSNKRDKKSGSDMKDIANTKGKKIYKDVKPNKNRHEPKKTSTFDMVDELPDLVPSETHLIPKLSSQTSSRSSLSQVNISKGSSSLLSRSSPSKGTKLSPSLSQKSPGTAPGTAKKCSRQIDRSQSLSKKSDASSFLPGSKELHKSPRTPGSEKLHVGKSFVPRTKVKEELKNITTNVKSQRKSKSEEISSNYSSKEGSVSTLPTHAKHQRKKRQLPDFDEPSTSSMAESSDTSHRIKSKLSDFGDPSTSLAELSDKHPKRKRQLPDFKDSSNLLTGESGECKSKSTKTGSDLEQKSSQKFRNVSHKVDRKSNDSKISRKNLTKLSLVIEKYFGVDAKDLDETKEMEHDHVLFDDSADEFSGIKDTLIGEIKACKHVRELNEEHLQFLVMSNKKYLRDIFEGEIYSERHELFKAGGKTRRDLNYRVHLGLFNEEQYDLVMETLMSIFCKKDHKYLDYLLRVLLPEMLIKIYMEVHGTSHAETDNIMASVPQKKDSF